jgi:hypothetical protein
MTSMVEIAHRKHRWFRLTPGWLLAVLLAVEGLLWLSNGLGWPVWHKGYAVLATLAVVGMTISLMLLWWVLALIFHLRFQFSLRSLLVLVVVIAVPCSWLSWEMRRAKAQGDAVDAIKTTGIRVFYDDFPRSPSRVGSGFVLVATFGPTSVPVWLRDLFGDCFFADARAAGLSNSAQMKHLRRFPQLEILLIHDVPVTDVDLQHLDGLTQLKSLTLDSPNVTDAGMGHLKGLTNLEVLNLWETHETDAGLQCLEGLTKLEVLGLRVNHGITDSGLAHLEQLTRLKELDLNNTLVTDAGLAHLKGLTNLEALDLFAAPITDAGLEHLKGLRKLRTLVLYGGVTDAGLEHLKEFSNLRYLSLIGTLVTDEGVKKLRQALPKCVIEDRRSQDMF